MNPPSPHDRFIRELRDASEEKRAAAAGELRVNDDLAAFGEIVSDKAPGVSGLCAGDCVHVLAVIVALQNEIESAHTGCDGLIARMSGECVRPLAERVSALRRIVEDRITAVYRDLKAEEEQRLLVEHQRFYAGMIVTFFVGAIVGVLLTYGFLAIG